MKQGILVLGHGSKAEEAEEVLEVITEKVRLRGDFSCIESASLQFNRPNLEEGIDNLVKKGADYIIVVPMFIFEGNHVKEDIPGEIKRVSAKYPNVQIVLSRNMGADDRIADILLDRIKEVL